MRPDNRWRLNSPAADDVRWFFRCAAAAIGHRASPCAPYAETETHGQRKGPECVYVHATKRSASEATTSKSDDVLAAVARERRIRTALEQVSTPTYRTLQLAYESRQHTPEIRRVLGDFADLAMRLPRCQAAYARYVEGAEKPLEIEVWLTKRCRDVGKGDGALRSVREDAERAIGDALAAYQTRRIPPGDDEKEEPQKPRRSPLERVRAAIMRDRGR